MFTGIRRSALVVLGVATLCCALGAGTALGVLGAATTEKDEELADTVPFGRDKPCDLTDPIGIPNSGCAGGGNHPLAGGIEPRIIGGEEAPNLDWPWTVALMRAKSLATDNRERQFCGGTLVSRRVVVTASHCLFTGGAQLEGDDVRVLVGRQNLNDLSTGQEIGVKRVVPHPEYRGVETGNDVGLLYLVKDAPGIAFPAVASTDLLSHALRQHPPQAWAIGWGLTSENGESSAELLMISLPLWSTTPECANAYRLSGYRIKRETMLCAGGDIGKDTCQGDSGGPLMARELSGEWALLGATSFGLGCGRQLPGVYAWAAGTKLRGWIAQELSYMEKGLCLFKESPEPIEC